MASSVSASVVIPQTTKQIHSEVSSSEKSSQPNPCVQSSVTVETLNNTAPGVESKLVEPKAPSVSKDIDNNVPKCQTSGPSNASRDSHAKNNATVLSSVGAVSEDCDLVKQQQKPACNAAKTSTEISPDTTKPTTETSSVEAKISSNGTLAGKPLASNNKDTKKTVEHSPTSSAVAPSSQLSTETGIDGASGPLKSTPEPMDTSVATASHDTIAKSSTETAASESKSMKSKFSASATVSDGKPQLEDGEEPEKKAKMVTTSNTSQEGGKTPEQILEYMDKTFEQRRKVVTKQMPTIPELKELYPDLFTGKQLLLEFQRITKIDIDQKVQEFCVRYATAVIELARNKKEAAPVLARWEQAKQENDTLRQYWDMVTALCLLPLHFGENFVEMVLEIGEDEEVVAQGKIVPTLVARGNIFRTDEFFLIAENTIVQEFEEFTIAFASLYSSYWVFNMEYPETIEDTYNYIQRCIVRQREPGAIPIACKNFTKTLLKWNKGKEGK